MKNYKNKMQKTDKTKGADTMAKKKKAVKKTAKKKSEVKAEPIPERFSSRPTQEPKPVADKVDIPGIGKFNLEAKKGKCPECPEQVSKPAAFASCWCCAKTVNVDNIIRCDYCGFRGCTLCVKQPKPNHEGKVEPLTCPSCSTEIPKGK